jgi:hypothetical protein
LVDVGGRLVRVESSNVDGPGGTGRHGLDWGDKVSPGQIVHHLIRGDFKQLIRESDDQVIRRRECHHHEQVTFTVKIA